MAGPRRGKTHAAEWPGRGEADNLRAPPLACFVLSFLSVSLLYVHYVYGIFDELDTFLLAQARWLAETTRGVLRRRGHFLDTEASLDPGDIWNLLQNSAAVVVAFVVLGKILPTSCPPAEKRQQAQGQTTQSARKKEEQLDVVKHPMQWCPPSNVVPPAMPVVKLAKSVAAYPPLELWPMSSILSCCLGAPAAEMCADKLAELTPLSTQLEQFAPGTPHAAPDNMHPKYCGLRLDEPTGALPRLDRFAPEPLGDVVQTWMDKMPCSERERQLIRVLATRLAEVPGRKDPITLLRFLRARRHNLDQSVQMFKSASAWRLATRWEHDFRTNSLDDSLHRRLDAHWPPTALQGRDRDGDPVYWIRLGVGCPEFLKEAPISFLAQHEVYVLTRLMQAMEELSHREGRPRMYMTVVVDLADLQAKHLSLSVVSKFKVCARIPEDYFPEMVKRIIVVGAPRLASALWALVVQLLDKYTREKIQVADSRQTFETLNQFVDEKWIPKALGGQNSVAGDPWCFPHIPGPASGPVPPGLMQDIKAWTEHAERYDLGSNFEH